MEQRYPLIEPAGATEVVLPSNIFTPWLRLRSRVDDTAVQIEDRHTMLGLLPLGVRRVRVPLGELRSMRVVTVVRAERLAAILGLLALVIVARLPVWADVLGLFLAAWLAPLTLIKELRIEDRSARRWSIPVCWFYTFDASLIAMDVQARALDQERSG